MRSTRINLYRSGSTGAIGPVSCHLLEDLSITWPPFGLAAIAGPPVGESREAYR